MPLLPSPNIGGFFAKHKIFFVGLACFIIGDIATFSGTDYYYTGRLADNQRSIDESTKRLDDLTVTNSELARSNKDITDKLARVSASLASASGIIDKAIGTTGGAQEKLQRIIDGFTRLRALYGQLQVAIGR